MEGAIYYYYDIPKNPVNDWLVAEHQKRFNAPPDFFTAGGFAAAMAVVAAVKKAKSTDTEKLIAAMEGMEFDTPKGKMIFRKEDHQALQSMYHFKVKVDPNVAWAVLELVRELKIEDMDVPDPQQALSCLLHLSRLRERPGEGSVLLGVLDCGDTPTPALPRKREREPTVIADTPPSQTRSKLP